MSDVTISLTPENIATILLIGIVGFAVMRIAVLAFNGNGNNA